MREAISQREKTDAKNGESSGNNHPNTQQTKAFLALSKTPSRLPPHISSGCLTTPAIPYPITDHTDHTDLAA